MKKKKITIVLAVLILFSTLGFSAIATNGYKDVQLWYNNIKIMLNGTEIVPKDANGKVVEPFIIGGTTYLPVRAISEALGIKVEWDAKTSTVILTEPGYTPEPTTTPVSTGEIKPGDIFTDGCYIVVDDVKILYSSGKFVITNDSKKIVRISASVVGVKADGTYEWLQSPSFGGVDETKYKRDLAANGWAVESFTNMVRPGDTLTATMNVLDLSSHGEGYPNPDIDGDGYYDITFTISPQRNEESIIASTSDTVTSAYRIKAE